jgi:subtilisin family serine protease
MVAASHRDLLAPRVRRCKPLAWHGELEGNVDQGGWVQGQSRKVQLVRAGWLGLAGVRRGGGSHLVQVDGVSGSAPGVAGQVAL